MIAGVILAAGAGTRFGGAKQLARWHHRPLVCYAVELALSAGLEPVVVVTGYRGEAVKAAVARCRGNRPAQVVFNPAWAEGQSTSLRAGLSALPAAVEAAIFLMADQPALTPAVITALLAAYRSGQPLIVAPAYQGRRGTPVLFARSLFAELTQVSGDQGGREVIAHHGDQLTLVEVNDPVVLCDVDRPEDLRHLGQMRRPD